MKYYRHWIRKKAMLSLSSIPLQTRNRLIEHVKSFRDYHSIRLNI